jgi:hypothetical protein
VIVASGAGIKMMLQRMSLAGALLLAATGPAAGKVGVLQVDCGLWVDARTKPCRA